MREDRRPENQLAFLEELRSIAQLGLLYAQDPFDRARYERLLELAAVEYSRLSRLPEIEITRRFLAELGHVTPKVGVDAAIFSPEGLLLLTRRADDGLWCLPCGWADLGETAPEAIRREVVEETGLEVEARSVIDVFSRLPGAYGEPHTSYHILYHCAPIGGELSPTLEAPELDFCDYTRITAWHRDHRERAERARRFWEEHLAPSGADLR